MLRYVDVILYDSIYRIKLPSCNKWILSSFNLETYVNPKIPRYNFFSCSNSPILASNRTVLLLCPPPPVHPKLGLTNLIVHSLFSRNPNLEVQIADQLVSQERSITGNHLKAGNAQNCYLVVLLWRRWFRRRILHWLNASKRFIVLLLVFSVKS